MTYAGKEEKSPAKDNHSNVDFRHSLKYGRFDPIELTLPMDWTMNPFGVLNWRHNFLSLRWLTKSMPLRKKRSALFDFFEFHATQKKANDMIGTRLGDHTTSIRLSHVQSMLSEFIEIGDKEAALICKKLMKRDI
jgi:hypothetical protein